MNHLCPLSILILLLFLFGCSIKLTNENQILFTPNEASLANLEVSSDAIVSIVKDNRGANTLQFSCGGKNQAPWVIVNDKSKSWKLSQNNYLAGDITNNGSADVLVEIRLDANGWGAQGIVVHPGETKTVKSVIAHNIPEYYSKKIIGMYNLPDGIISTSQNVDTIHKLSFLVACPVKESTILISNIRAEGEVKFPSKEKVEGDLFPLVDEFGQYCHTDWPEKTHSVDELKKSAETEEADLANHPRSAEWDKYGGWLKGPQFKATGSFRTEKVNGKWWLVDPEGRLFWSHGMGSVAVDDGQVTLTDREFYFKDLPDSIKFRQFYSIDSWVAPFGYYKGRTTRSFNETGWNLYRKYGGNYKEKAISMVPKRLESWGQNTLGAWTAPDLYLRSTMPYTPIIMIESRKIEGSEGHWYKFTDPYDSTFIGNLTRGIKAIGKSTTDPNCIGYYVDNEITWGDTTGVARWTIASPANQPAKIVMLAFLKKKYKTINDLNTKWNTKFAAWDEFMSNTKPLDIRNEDTKEFTMTAITDYFKFVNSTLKKLAPDKLYLGPRLDFHFYPSEVNLNDWDARTSWIVNIAAQYCDVVSFNRYRHTAADVRPGDFDKPIIIGEWHHTPLEKGSFYKNAEHFNECLKMRAEKYEYFEKSCMENPYIVGAHYFQYFDQPTVGRVDGENFSCGFLNICDRPHAAMVNASRKMGNEMYKMRYQGK
jgi:hypothetical protein